MSVGAPNEIAAIIVAAGRGERAGQSAEGPKQYRRIGGRAVIERSFAALRAHPAIGRIVIAIHPDDHDLLRTAMEGTADYETVEGGPSRQASTLLALRSLAASPPAHVLIHDAVRPFADTGLIDRVVESLGSGAGVLPALSVADTLKRGGEDGYVQETVPRDGLYAAQTPQGFAFQAILDAHERAATVADRTFTDDASIAEWAGVPVMLVDGVPENVKLTFAHDIAAADRRLRAEATVFPDIRVGNGYDVHSFEPGDIVVLCGVEIPHEARLSGHSDADVGLHALTDALLATCGAGDIGTHFPPSDPQWRGAASHRFVRHAVSLVKERGGRIANADVTLICEAPRIGPHREAMVAAMAGMLGIDPVRVSVKATTNERLGFVGRREGIAAIATASVAYPGMLPE